MRVLLLTIGSSGDVHPFIGIGLALRERGHRVAMIVNPHFENLVRQVGLEFIPLGEAADFEQMRNDPNLWHRRRAMPLVMKVVGEGLRQVYQAVVDHYVPGETVIAASSLALGARVAQDRFDLPLATVHLAPAVLVSAHAPPKLPGVLMPQWLPVTAKRMIFSAAHRWVVDRWIAPAVNAFRAELGLAPVHHILSQWWNSPQRVIGLWPDWYAPPQPDWPANTSLAGFPLYDEAQITPVPTALQQFLAAGDKPIVFTPGSAMHHAHRFFEAAVTACRKLRRPGILLTRHRGHLPTQLPLGIAHFDYAPLSRILSQAAALVHHGGIGTTAQALAAGVPQVVCAFSYDQFDNGDRVQQLGVGELIRGSNRLAARMEAAIESLLNDEHVARKCVSVREQFAPARWRQETCDVIERLGGA